MVLTRLRKSGPSFSETLDKPILNKLLKSLFPRRDDCNEDRENFDPDLVIEDDISYTEFAAALKRGGGDKAPGIDGIPTVALKLAPARFHAKIVEFFNCCLCRGVFPSPWKVARLVFIPKGDCVNDTSPKARPICLINDITKIFERILCDRINAVLERNCPGTGFTGLSERQFGFRKGKSTMDAILEVKSIVDKPVKRGEVAIAVGIDIANAFNSLPWSCIRSALRKKGIPPYLRRIIDSYLQDRFVDIQTAMVTCADSASRPASLKDRYWVLYFGTLHSTVFSVLNE